MTRRPDKTPYTEAADIFRAIAEREGLKVADMVVGRSPRIVSARWEAFRELKARGHSLAAIGRATGYEPETVRNGIEAGET